MVTEVPIEVIIVNYRTPQLSLNCARSIIERGIAKAESIIIVDNNSGDGSPAIIREGLPRSRIVASPENNGFGGGINKGMRLATARYVLVLNPDTYFRTDGLTAVADYLDRNPTVGLVGLDLVNPDGSRQYSARRFYSLLDIVARRVSAVGRILKRRVDHHLMLDAWYMEEPFDAEWVMGTGFVIRRDVFNAIGGMDEGYFLYMEDVDLCARVWEAGYRVVGMPSAQLVHDHQRSSASGPLSPAGRRHLVSLMRFYWRYQVPLVRPPGIQRLRR